MRSSRATLGLISAFALGCGNGGGSTGQGQDGSEADSGLSGTDTGATASASASATAGADETSTTSAEDGESGPPPVKLDVHGIPDTPGAGPCGGKGGKGGGGDEPDFSYIWVANSIESTVSKIDTQTMEEVGRYLTRPDGAGSPSRTSVSLNGDVAVANRNGGVVKIYAHPDSCDEPSNTSEGAADVKAFPDGCVAWYTPFPYSSQRPVAWAPGDWNSATCQYENEKLWTSGANASIDVLLLDGDTGEVEQTIAIAGVNPSYFGIYGGAVDADGNFWGTMLGGPSMIFADRSSYDYIVYPMAGAAGGYGMTVDEFGRPWSCGGGVAVFDPDTETWDSNPSAGSGGGCMVDGQGFLWISGNNSMVGVDIETLDVAYDIPIPNYVHGVSIDFYGYVWGVTHSQTWAYRVDVENETFETFTGLNGPYTYSDMTGWALSNAVGPPPSG